MDIHGAAIRAAFAVQAGDYRRESACFMTGMCVGYCKLVGGWVGKSCWERRRGCMGVGKMVDRGLLITSLLRCLSSMMF